MQDLESIFDRDDINAIIDKVTTEKAEELRIILYDTVVNILADILKTI